MFYMSKTLDYNKAMLSKYWEFLFEHVSIKNSFITSLEKLISLFKYVEHAQKWKICMGKI